MKNWNWKQILKVVALIAVAIVGLILAYHLVMFLIGLVVRVVSWIWSMIQLIVIIGAAIFGWNLMSGHHSAPAKRHSGFMSSAKDNIPDAKNRVSHAEDQVGNAMDNISHIFRSDRDRRRGR